MTGRRSVVERPRIASIASETLADSGFQRIAVMKIDRSGVSRCRCRAHGYRCPESEVAQHFPVFSGQLEHEPAQMGKKPVQVFR
jgi:hypothetical protein